MPVEHLEWAIADLKARRDGYARARAYYHGDHDLTFATEKFRNAFGTLFRTFADNLSAPVVDALADRLQLRGFTGDDRTEEFFRVNRLARRSGEVHLTAPMLGDAFVIVWPNRMAEPRVYPQAPENVAVLYDEEDDPGLIVRAAKVWKSAPPGEKALWRAVLYYPDHLERLEADATKGANAEEIPKPGRWRPRVDDITPGPDGIVVNPWGRPPVFHFAHNAAIGQYGRSRLVDVIPIQNALNKSVADLLVAGEFLAFPQRHATGIEVARDPVTGEEPAEGPFRAGADRLWWTANKEASFGQFAAADLGQLVAVNESFRLEVARVSGTPLHYFNVSGDVPSGVALTVLEGRLTTTADDCVDSFGDVWQEVGTFGLGMTGPEPAELMALWESTATRDEDAELARAEAKVRLGVSRRQALRELGYTEDQLEQMDEERQTEQAAMGAAMLAAFDGDRPVSTAQGRGLAMMGAGETG